MEADDRYAINSLCITEEGPGLARPVHQGPAPAIRTRISERSVPPLSPAQRKITSGRVPSAGHVNPEIGTHGGH